MAKKDRRAILRTTPAEEILEILMKQLDTSGKYSPEEAGAITGCTKCRAPCLTRPLMKAGWIVWACSDYLKLIKPYYKRRNLHIAYLWRKYTAMVSLNHNLLVKNVQIELSKDDVAYLCSKLPPAKKGGKNIAGMQLRLALLSREDRIKEFGYDPKA